MNQQINTPRLVEFRELKKIAACFTDLIGLSSVPYVCPQSLDFLQLSTTRTLFHTSIDLDLGNPAAQRLNANTELRKQPICTQHSQTDSPAIASTPCARHIYGLQGKFLNIASIFLKKHSGIRQGRFSLAANRALDDNNR